MCSVSPIDDTASNCVSRDVAVVAVADLGELGQSFVGDRLLRPLGLLWRDSVTPMVLTPWRAA